MPDDENNGVQENDQNQPDELDFDVTSDEDEEDETEIEEPDEKDDEESEEEGDDKEDDDDDKIAALQKELENARKEINRLGYALRKQQAPKDEKKNEEPVFTDQQLVAIIDQHADDPAVLLQVFKQVAKQETSNIKQDAQLAVETKQTQQQLDNFLYTNWPELKDEQSEQRQQMESAKEWMQLKDHPYGNYLAMAAAMVQQLPDLIEQTKKSVKEELLKEQAEAARKKNIKGKQPAAKGTKSKQSGDIPPDLMETAKTIGLNKRQAQIYAKLISSAKKGVSLTTEV